MTHLDGRDIENSVIKRLLTNFKQESRKTSLLGHTPKFNGMDPFKIPIFA